LSDGYEKSRKIMFMFAVFFKCDTMIVWHHGIFRRKMNMKKREC